jgi:hypothetical protein
VIAGQKPACIAGWGTSFAVLVALLAAGSAAAHDFERRIQPVLEASVPGVTVQVRTNVAPVMEVRNRTPHTLELLGNDGRPFVRLGPRGVEANVASPDLYRSNAPVPGTAVPAIAKPHASPVWVRIAREPAWSWFEHRLDARAAQVGERWAIPARLGGRTIRFTGRWTSAVVRGAFRTVVDGTRPRIDGISVEALGGQPALLLQNTTGELLEVADARGRPFVRVGPAGVEMRQTGGAWTRMGATPAWAWLERRAAPPRREWSIEAKLGGRPLAIFGHVEWRPVSAHHDSDGSRLGIILLAASAPLLLAALFFVFRLNR